MDLITRLAALVIAILLGIDALSAERTETLRVDRHTRVARWHQGDDYRLYFTGGRAESCEVGWSVFNALNDGDLVSVETSRVFKSCDGIHRGDEVISQARAHRWLLLVPMAILLAAAFGWIRFERRYDDERAWWFS